MSHRDGSFENPQHMFWLRNKKNNFQLHTLIWAADSTTKPPGSLRRRIFWYFSSVSTAFLGGIRLNMQEY